MYNNVSTSVYVIPVLTNEMCLSLVLIFKSTKTLNSTSWWMFSDIRIKYLNISPSEGETGFTCQLKKVYRKIFRDLDGFQLRMDINREKRKN